MNLLSYSSLLSGLPLALDHARTWWMPQQSSTVAPTTDALFYVIFYICTFFFVLVVATMLLFVWQYRHRPGHEESPSPHHNFAIEVIWSVIPLILVIVIFWVGYKGYLNVITPPPNAYEIGVTGQQWQWTFTYPSGYVGTELHAPADTPVVLTMTSEDVLHAVFIPDFRIKQDVVPGRYTKIWFNAPEPGEHVLTCAEYCGAAITQPGKEPAGHSFMRTKCVIHSPAEFDKWLKDIEITEIDDVFKRSPVELGKRVYDTFGCKQCHSVEGAVSTGPTWKGIFGHPVKLSDGTTVTADENYIRESIVDPAAKVVQGFDPVMPTFKGRLRDKQITGVIAYIKTLSQ